MAQTVRLPDGRTASFPDEATPDQIQSALLETFPQFKPTEPDPGYLGDTWRGLKHGVEVTLPESTGKALKFFGAEDTGQGLIDYAKSNDTPDLQESAVGRAHDKWYSPRGNVYEAGDNAVLSMAPGAAGAAIGAGIGMFAGPGGAALGALAGYGIGSIASLPIFYGSQAQESYEAVLKHQRDIGTPEDEAQRIARSTAHAEGSIEAGGELVQDTIPFAKLFKTFGKPVAKAVVSGVLKPTLTGAAKTVGQVVGGEVATEMAQQAGEDWARKAIGDTGEGATWDETAKVIMPTALMSVVPGGAGAGAHHYKRTVALNALSSPETDPDVRARIAVGAAAAMADGNEDISRAFAKYASDQIEAKAPIEIKDDDQFYLQYRLSAAKTGAEAVAAAEAALAAPVDALAPAITDWQSSFDANRVPADSAVAPIGVDMQGPPAPAPTLALPTDTAPATGPIADVPLSLTGEQIIATADRLADMPIGAQTQELLALDRPTRQAVVRAMQPSGIVVPAALDAGQGQAGILTNEATTAASSVQPVGDASATNVPAYTQRAAQEIVSKDPSQEMRPHRDVPNRFEVVPKMQQGQQAIDARAMPPTLPISPTQQQLAEQEVPAAPATRPVVPAKPLTAAQVELNRMAADAERSSLPRRSIFRNSQLRDADAPDIKGEKVTHNMRRFLTQIGKLTGTKVVFEFAPEDSEGAVPVRGENVIHINTAAQINPLQVMGHEVTHVLKDRHREAWVSIRDALVATMPDKRKALDAFAEDYWHTHPDRLEAARAMPDWSQKLTPEQMKQFNSGENTIDAFLLDEMTSDLGGSHWSSEQFWTDVFAKIEAKHGSEKAKGIIQRLVASIKEALNKFLMVVRAQKQGDYTTVTPEQLTATRDAVTSAYAKFINEERTATPEYGTNTLDRRIRTSDVTSRSKGAEQSAPEQEQRAAAPVPETGDIDDLEAARENELSQLSPQRKDQRLFFEVAPNPKDSTAVAAWQQRTDKEKQTVSNDVVERIIPGLLRDIGVTGKVVTQLGGWKAHTNPSFALVVTRGDAALAARAIGYVLDQEAVYAMGLTPFTGSTKTGIIHFDLGGKKAHDIYKQVRELARAVITGHSTVGNEMLIGLAVAQMDRFESAIVAIARKNDVAVRFDEGYGAIIGEKDYDIQHRQGNTSGQHTAEGRIADWRTKARAVFAGQSDAGGNERNGSIAPETDRRKERSVSAVGIHYSRAQRDYLSSSAYGTGLRGAEAERVAQSDDPRIKHRIYFYVNSGRGIRPEQGVGAHAHRASLTNLYDQNADPLNLTLGRDANEFESSVLDAGFNGYVTHDAGMAVLLGPRTAHVEYVGRDNSPAVPVAEKATPSTYRSQLASLAARKDLPSGKMSGADWKRMVKDIDVSHLTDTDAYYKDQLVQPPVARMSEQRPPSWYYSPLTRAAESATMKTAPASGWKDWLKSLPAKGVKPDEIKWSGIEEWLDVQGKQPVTKQQVQSFLSDFGIKVETILRGERNPKSSAVVSQNIDADEEPAEIHISFGEWETEEPDEYYLYERAKEQLDEEIDNRVDIEGGYIADDIQRYNFMQIEVKVLNIVADAQQQMGEMFPVDETQVEQYARSIAAAQVAGDTWQEYADEDADLTDEDVQVEATNRAFAVLSGDMTALETEAERRARAEIDEDKVLEALIDLERQSYYDDSEAPQTRIIRVEGMDYEFYNNIGYGDQTLTYRGNDIRLPRNADDADIEGIIYSYLADEGLLPDVVSTSTDGTGFVPTKWDDYITDGRRAVPGSYREVQLTLPPGTHGEVKSRPDPVGDSRGEAGAITERADAKDFIYTVHWNEKNVVGHARFDEHIDENGKRVMILQEIQGDWGQQRREGVDAQAEIDRLYPLVVEKRGQVADARKALESLLPDTAGWKTTDWVNVERLGSRGLAATANNDVGVAADKLMKVDEQLRELERNLNQVESEASNIPAVAPFIEKTVQWSGLVMKRMIAHAIEYGFDKVVWTSGAQQVERWKGSLRKEVDTIAWEKTPEGIHIVASKNGKVRSDTRLAETVLSDHIGKAMAKQIISDPNQSGEITGDDITISDTGMAGFYDRMLPNVTNDILKKLDKSVRVHDIEVHPVDEIDTASTPNGWVVLRNGRDDSPFFDTESKAIALKEKIEAAQTRTAITTQQGFEITDKLRESAANGLPLMSERRRAAADRKANDRRAWYYSQLSVAVNDIPRKIKTGKEAALWLQSNAAKLGVKKDELVWSGVLDWLAAQPTPAGVSDWLANNGVRVREVVLGEETPEYRRLDAELQEQDAEVARLRKAAFGAQWKNQSSSYLAMDRINRTGVVENDDPFSPEQLDAMMEYGRALNRKNELFEQRNANRGEPVKFDTPDLTLPGGSRYRELLLTLPENAKPYTYSVRESDTSRWEVMQNESFSGYVVYDKDLKPVSGKFDDIEDARDWLRMHKKDNHYDVIENETGKNVLPRATPSLTLAEGFAESFNEQRVTDPKSKFVGSHFPNDNIIAHLRFNEHTDADGKRVLFIEEVQSDWAQVARRERKKIVAAKAKELGITVEAASKLVPLSAGFVSTPTFTIRLDGDSRGDFASREDADRYLQENSGFEGGVVEQLKSKGPPLAPFVTDTKAWTALALKRAIAYAIDNGFDRVAYTTGEQQADRYDLSKQVSQITVNWYKAENDTVMLKAYGLDGEPVITKNEIPRSEMDKYIGKEAAKKADDQLRENGQADLTGLDLKVGGEGMHGFYDQIVPQVARSLGATMGTVQLAERDPGTTVVQPGFDITDAMRKQAAIGMPLFSERRAPIDQWAGKTVVRNPDGTLRVMYHGTSRDITTFRPQQAAAIFLTDNPEFAANFADLSHSWMVNNYWTWMSPEQMQAAKRDAMRLLLKDALPGSSLYIREERLLNQSQQPSQYMRRAVEQYMPSESNIMPLYVRAENPFDYRNPAHVAAIEAEIGTSWLGQEAINGEMHEVSQHIGDLERGDWNAIESPQVQAYIRQHHDSFYVRERGVTNLAVFSPNQVKSASGNSGAYSRKDNDIRRSERRATWTEARIDQLMRKYAYTMDDSKTKAFAAWIDPEDFLRMTSAPDDLARIERAAGELDEDALRENDQELFLEVSDITAALVRVEGHEGRHRTTALIKAGVRKMPVVLWLRGGAMREAESTKSLYLAPQKFGREAHQRAIGGGFVTDLTPISYAYEQQLRDTFGGDGNVRFSTPRSKLTGRPINQSWDDPNVTDWDDLVRKMQDDKIDTKRVLKAIRDAGVAIKTKFDAYLLETNYHGRAAARVDEFANGELRKLLEDMAMRDLSMQDLDDYLWARHAPERNAANNRSNPAITDGAGMSDAQSAAILAGKAVTVGTRTIQLTPAALQAAAAVSSRVDEITKGTLDLLVSYGLETQQTVDTWKRTYSSYVPLKRDMESDVNYSGAFNLGNGTGAGFDVRGSASKRALGSKRAVTDILANIAMQRERAITRGEKNRVSQAVYGLALSAPNPEFWIPVNPELNKRLTPAALAKVVAELVGIGVNPIDAQNLATEPVQRFVDPNTGLESQRINPALRSRENVLSTRINGEERYVFFSNKKRAQEMVRGLKNLDAAQVSGALQVIAPVTRWFASINTQYNPIFGLTNGVRDFSTGMLNLSSTDIADKRGEVAREAFAALRGVYADLRDHRAGRTPTSKYAQLFEQFAMDGGQTGYRDAFATSADRAEAIADELRHAGKGQNWLAVGEKRSHIFGWLSDYNTAVENAMRLASYKVYLDKYLKPGMTAQQQQDVRDKASFTAKNLTVNFNKKGLAATQTGALYAFFNASVQGTARIAETTLKDGKLTDAGKKIVYGGIMLGVLQAMLGAAAGWDDDEPPQFSREKNFIIPIPGTDKVVNVPMPLGFHVLPNIGRITAEWMMSGFKNPGKRLTNLASVILDSFNPIGSGTLAQTLSPTIGDPIVALSENKDWTGKSIYKEDFDKLHPTPGWTRTKDTASPPARWFAKAANYVTGGGKYGIGMWSPTPDVLDYLVGQGTGGTGRELLKVAQYTSAKASGEELPMHKVPFGVGRFIGETNGQSSEVNRFYGNLQRIGEHKSALNEMKHAGDGSAIREYLAENPDARLVQVADKAQREIAYLRRQKREVLEKGGNPERVKMLDQRITATAALYNQVLRGR